MLLFKTLKDLLDDRIKPAMETKFTTLQSMFTQLIEDTMNRRIMTLYNITAEAMNRTINQIREDNVWLKTQVADLIGEVRSTMAVKVIQIWSPPVTVTPLPLISDPEVAEAADDR